MPDIVRASIGTAWIILFQVVLCGHFVWHLWTHRYPRPFVSWSDWRHEKAEEMTDFFRTFVLIGSVGIGGVLVIRWLP